ncbi:MAG: EF-Tu/IF-2/RF-3 family GTPase [Chloroflexi bacterium]|nr:EF-Tu/IF-2/RF-3 family GTPase [Chloroflexota bacterium]
MDEIEVGTVNEFFARPVVAGISLNGSIKLGDKIKIAGHTTNIEIFISSMQINNKEVDVAIAGDAIGIKVPERVRPGDKVYLVKTG